MSIGLKSDSHLPKKIALFASMIIRAFERPLKMMKSYFLFYFKSSFVLKIFKFLPCLYGHVERTTWLET